MQCQTGADGKGRGAAQAGVDGKQLGQPPEASECAGPQGGSKGCKYHLGNSPGSIVRRKSIQCSL